MWEVAQFLPLPDPATPDPATVASIEPTSYDICILTLRDLEELEILAHAHQPLTVDGKALTLRRHTPQLPAVRSAARAVCK